MTAAGFRKLLSRIGTAAEFPFPVHPHSGLRFLSPREFRRLSA